MADRKERMTWAFAEINERQKPGAIRTAIEEHGFPVHLYGLLGALHELARELPYDRRPRVYGEIMEIVDDLFERDYANSHQIIEEPPVSPLEET